VASSCCASVPAASIRFSWDSLLHAICAVRETPLRAIVVCVRVCSGCACECEWACTDDLRRAQPAAESLVRVLLVRVPTPVPLVCADACAAAATGNGQCQTQQQVQEQLAFCLVLAGPVTRHMCPQHARPVLRWGRGAPGGGSWAGQVSCKLATVAHCAGDSTSAVVTVQFTSYNERSVFSTSL